MVMDNLKDLEFLAAKSKEIIDKQIAAYRQKQTVAGFFIAIIALFIPLFMNGLDDAYFWIKASMLLPLGLFVTAICMLLSHILLTKVLSQAIGFNRFQDLVDAANYEKVLLTEIGANKSSFIDNETKTGRAYRYFNYSIIITIISIIISVVLLLANKFFKPPKVTPPIQIEIIKPVPITNPQPSLARDTAHKNVQKQIKPELQKHQ